MVAAVVVTALGCLLGAWAWNATTSTEEVLAATNTIHRGEVITADDIRRIRISGDPALEPLPASAYDEIVGQRAALDISAGGLITTESTTDAPMPPEGQSIVGISLTPAQVPALPMHGGDKVRIIVTPAANGDAPTGAPQFTAAEVVDTRDRRDDGQHRRQRPGAVRRRECPRGPRRDRQRRADPRLGSRVMAIVVPDLGVRLPRRHHHRSRHGVQLATARRFSSRPTRPADPASSPGSSAARRRTTPG